MSKLSQPCTRIIALDLKPLVKFPNISMKFILTRDVRFLKRLRTPF